MEPKDIDDADDWQSVPGWILFAILMVFYTKFILLTSNTRLSYADRFIRISPLHCLYDILHRTIEIAHFIVTEMRPDANEQYDWYLNIHLGGPGTIVGAVLTFVTAMALLVLWTVRNAFWTQLFAALYVLHWVTNTHFTLDWHSLSAERRQSHRRSAGFLFAYIAYWTLRPGIDEKFGLGTQTQILIDGLFAGLVAASAYACPVNSHSEPSLSAMIGEFCALSSACMTWSFGFSPITLATQFHHHRTAREEFWMAYSPAIYFHAAMLCFLFSRGSLEVARPWVKAVVGAMWLGIGVFYYCWFYEVYRPLGVPMAEGRGLQTLLGYNAEAGKDSL